MDKNQLLMMSKDISRNSVISVGITPVLLSSEQTTNVRKVLALTNTSTAGQVIYLSWGEQAQANQGIPLTPNSSWTESIDSAYVPSGAPIWAIASAVGATIAIQERLI